VAWTEVANDAWLENGRFKTGGADQDVVLAYYLGNLVGGIEPILEGQQATVCIEQPAGCVGCLVEVVRFHAKEDQVGLAECAWIAGRLAVDGEGAEIGALDAQATIAKGLEVRATRQEADLMTRAGQQSTVQPTDTAGADDRYSHSPTSIGRCK
jgi:hypothetical protein